MTLRLVVFDVDGTLVDSQGDITASMSAAFLSEGLDVPPRDAILRIVGLTLDTAMRVLAPGLADDVYDRLVAAYKASYQRLRAEAGAASSPLYPGMGALLNDLAARDDVLLGIATGKSRRGLLALLDNHGLQEHFVTLQVADDHPSKPHPSMLLTAMSETGVEPEQAVMIGDTTFDRDMAQAARMPFLGVAWGYHPAAELTGAIGVAPDAAALAVTLDRWRETA